MYSGRDAIPAFVIVSPGVIQAEQNPQALVERISEDVLKQARSDLKAQR